MKLYEGISDPVTKQPIDINDEIIRKLCQSNITLLNDLAMLTPLVAVAQRDIKKMVEMHFSTHYESQRDMSHILSDLEKDKLLYRHHPLSQTFSRSLLEREQIPIPSSQQGTSPPAQVDWGALDSTLTSHQDQKSDASDVAPTLPPSVASRPVVSTLEDDPQDYLMDTDYFITPSEFDMEGEMSRFLLSDEGQASSMSPIPLQDIFEVSW
ncbi:hypothetical protein ColTof3_08743 [Colletotrichum tofieldiae]|nr:hypothetical protein ColTof3_08743 [Colletotrichum tofieldiae]